MRLLEETWASELALLLDLNLSLVQSILKAIERWCRRERQPSKFELFRARLG